MGSLVDWLACTSLNSNENGTSSKNKSFSGNACFVEEKSHGQKSHEDEKEKSIGV